MLHPLHEEVWDPKSQEQIPGALLLLAMVLAKLNEVIDIRMPRLQIPQQISAGTNFGFELEETWTQELKKLDLKPET